VDITMRLPSRFPRPLAALVALGLLSYLAVPAVSDEPQSQDKAPQAKPADPEKAKQVAEIEKQIAELNKKLSEIKAGPAGNGNANANAAADKKPIEGVIPDSWAKALQWRCIGPANMGGRIVAMSVFENDPCCYWVATASGGLLKTSNNGITFDHQFDHEGSVSIGDVCVAPSNKEIIYVGTGENNPRNSVSYGDGVYKSTDGGKNWKNVGLKKSYQIGKIVVHPKDPNIVYVGALGRLYGPSEERGVYKTTDGGQNWKKILFVDDKTGVIDMKMSPADPNTLIVAAWEHKRDEYDGYFENAPVPDQYGPVVTHGPGSALYKTTDGGESFKKITSGIPTVKLGRIGLDWSKQHPNVVYALIDTEKAGTGNPPSVVYMGIQGDDANPGAKLTTVIEDGPAAKAGLKVDDIVLKLGDIDVTGYDQLVDKIREKKVGDKVKVKISRDKKDMEIEVTLAQRPAEGGRGGRGAGGGGGGGGGRGQGGGFGGPRVSAGFRGEDAKEGLKVTTIVENSPAAKAGLKVDDIVTGADGKAIDDFREFMQETSRDKKAGDKMKLSVLRGKEKLDLELTLAEIDVAQLFQGGGGRGGGLPGGASRDKPYSSGLGGQQANVQDQQGKDGWQTGGVYRSDDAGDTWKRVNSLNPRPMYFSLIRIDPQDDKNIYVGGVGFAYSTDGGKRFQSGRDRGVHSDHHALWVDPRDGRHLIIGTDGGFYVTYDRGEHWDHHNFQALGQFYHVSIDPRANYRVFGGLQDNGSWGGPAFSPRGGIVNEDWLYINGGDGFVCRVDPNDPDIVYAESQGGAMSRRNLRTGERGFIGTRRAAGTQRHRFNWNTPFILSAHNSSIFYAMGEQVFRSLNKGENMKAISPDLTRSKMGSGTALSESPRNADVLYAGTDDGNLWVTKDGGAKWVNVIENVKKAGLPGFRWVATLEASKYADGRCYACFDAHRSDDDNPYLFVTEDYGETWKPVAGNLPSVGSTRCLREDIKNQDVLYCGTEFGAYASVNRGQSWTRINNNLPTVAVHEFAQHPITGEIVAATHGRSIWITDISPIRQMSAAVVKDKAKLYTPAPAIRWRVENNRGMFAGADRKFVGQNPPRGAQVYYSLTQKAQKVELKVVDYAGQVVRRLEANTEPGLYRVNWDLARLPNMQPGRGNRPGGFGPGGTAGGGGGGGAAAQPATESATPAGPGGPGAFGFGGALAATGTYRVVLTVDGQEQAVALRVEPDPTAPASLSASENGEKQDMDEDEDEEHEEREQAKIKKIID
jgi:photosystem II stability/assembly factor-like uncharacterized protein